ncbi:unnamed protein product, partial [Ectocarpus sp. 4 AP-2014]
GGGGGSSGRSRGRLRSGAACVVSLHAAVPLRQCAHRSDRGGLLGPGRRRPQEAEGRHPRQRRRRQRRRGALPSP